MTKKKVGRPQKTFNWETLDGILQYGATVPDAAEILGVSEDTIERSIKKNHGLTFAEYRNKKMGRVRIKLLQKQIAMALNGSVPLLIWLGKQYLGQSEKQEIEHAGNSVIRIEKDDEKL